jgi:hypothetical protein
MDFSYRDEAPVLFGHYWLNGEPHIQNPRATCLDFSVAKGGYLTAYRWSGDPELQAENLVWVPPDSRTQIASGGKRPIVRPETAAIFDPSREPASPGEGRAPPGFPPLSPRCDPAVLASFFHRLARQPLGLADRPRDRSPVGDVLGRPEAMLERLLITRLGSGRLASAAVRAARAVVPHQCGASPRLTMPTTCPP